MSSSVESHFVPHPRSQSVPDDIDIMVLNTMPYDDVSGIIGATICDTPQASCGGSILHFEFEFIAQTPSKNLSVAEDDSDVEEFISSKSQTSDAVRHNQDMDSPRMNLSKQFSNVAEEEENETRSALTPKHTGLVSNRDEDETTTVPAHGSSNTSENQRSKSNHWSILGWMAIPVVLLLSLLMNVYLAQKNTTNYYFIVYERSTWHSLVEIVLVTVISFAVYTIFHPVSTKSIMSRIRTAEDHRQIKSGIWTAEEHRRFVILYDKHGQDWVAIANGVSTRSFEQVRAHGYHWRRIGSPDTMKRCKVEG